MILDFLKNRKKFLKITPTGFGWGYGYGFFSNYRACLQQLIENERNGKLKPYIDWSNTTWVPGIDPMVSKKVPKNQENPFDWWFEQESPQKFDKIKKSNGKLDFDVIDHSLDYFNDSRLEEQQNIDSKYIKPKQFILEKIDKIYEKEFKDNNVLGVMARGCEYNAHHPFYGVFGVEEYIKEIKRVLNIKPEINKIFIVTEDSNYIERFEKEFDNIYFVPNVFRRTDETQEYMDKMHHWCNISKKRENHTKLLGEEVIIQTKLLGMCDYLLGRHSGIFCGAILWNKNIKEVFKIEVNAQYKEIIGK